MLYILYSEPLVFPKLLRREHYKIEVEMDMFSRHLGYCEGEGGVLFRSLL
jgi:hypothetical protein